MYLAIRNYKHVACILRLFVNFISDLETEIRLISKDIVVGELRCNIFANFPSNNEIFVEKFSIIHVFDEFNYQREYNFILFCFFHRRNFYIISKGFTHLLN